MVKKLLLLGKQTRRPRFRPDSAVKSSGSDHDLALLQEHPTVALEAGYRPRYICEATLCRRPRKIGFEAWPRLRRGVEGYQGELECGSIDGTF
jgi:hypothetical protein